MLFRSAVPPGGALRPPARSGDHVSPTLPSLGAPPPVPAVDCVLLAKGWYLRSGLVGSVRLVVRVRGGKWKGVVTGLTRGGPEPSYTGDCSLFPFSRLAFFPVLLFSSVAFAFPRPALGRPLSFVSDSTAGPAFENVGDLAHLPRHSSSVPTSPALVVVVVVVVGAKAWIQVRR